MGRVRVTARQVRPFGEIQAPGRGPAEPTATKPSASAAAASICREAPGPSSAPTAASVPRCQPVRPATTRRRRPSGPRPGPRPARDRLPSDDDVTALTGRDADGEDARAGEGRAVSAACQVWPSAEVTTTGCCAAADCTPPTATHPATPCTTLDSVCRPGRFSAAAGAPVPRVQLVPALAENHVAGKPFALPTATWLLPSAAMSSTATCGSTAPGMRAKLTGVSRPALSRVSAGCWPSGPAAVLPAATTAPPVVTATPAMVPAVALPSTPTGRQAVPLALVNARRLPALLPVITAPAGPPSTAATVSPAPPWAVTVVANFQAAPSAEVNTTAPVPALDLAGPDGHQPVRRRREPGDRRRRPVADRNGHRGPGRTVVGAPPHPG